MLMRTSIYTLLVALTVLHSPTTVVATAATTQQDAAASSMTRTGQGYGLVRRRTTSDDGGDRHFEDVVTDSTDYVPSESARTTSPPDFISNDTARPTVSPTTSPSEAPTLADVEEKTVPVTVSVPPVKKGDGSTLTLEVGAVIGIGLAGVMTPFLCGLIVFLCRRETDEKPSTSPEIPSGVAALSGSGGGSPTKSVPASPPRGFPSFPSDAAFRCINCKSTDITENSSDAESPPPPVATIYIGNSFKKSKRSLRPSTDAIEEQEGDDNRSVHSVNSYFRSIFKRRNLQDTGSLKSGDDDDESIPMPKDSAHQFDRSATEGGLNESFSSYGMDSTFRGAFADHILGGHLTDDEKDFEDVLAAPAKSSTAHEEEDASFRIMRLAL